LFYLVLEIEKGPIHPPLLVHRSFHPRSTTPSSRIRKGLGDERVTACRAAPTLKNHLQPDSHTKSFFGSLLGLTITSTPQGHFKRRKDISCTERALSPPNYLITSPALWPSCRNYLSRRVDPFLPLRKKERVVQSYSSAALGLTRRRIVKSAWPTFTTRRKTNWAPSTTTNNSRTSQPMSPQLTLPKMKTRSTEGFGEQKTPSALNAGATRRIASALQGI
jgi:hypothetical protein